MSKQSYQEAQPTHAIYVLPNQGGRVLLNIFKNKNASTKVLGLYASDSGLALAQAERDGNNLKLLRVDYLAAMRPEFASVLSPYIAEHGLQGAQLHWVGAQPDYSLVLLEPPKVPAEELKEALRWRIKDMVSFPVADAALDVIQLPDDAYPNRSMLYVVAAPASLITEAEQLADNTGLRLKVVDVVETALANLPLPGIEESQATAVLHLRPGSSTLNVMKNGDLYMSRGINARLHWDEGSLMTETSDFESLMLEVQRSLDYYESQLRQAPVTRLLLLPWVGASDMDLAERFYTSLGLKAEQLQVEQLLPAGSPAADAPKLAAKSMLAIAAALREEVAAS